METSNSKKVIVRGEIEHRLTTKLAIALQSHIAYQEGRIDLRERQETVSSAKYLFVDFLDEILAHKKFIELPKELDFRKIEDFYRFSDVDWQDYQQLEDFSDGYCSVMESR